MIQSPLTHTGSILCFGHASWAAVETLVSSLCVTALLVSRADISHALIDVCKSAPFTIELLRIFSYPNNYYSHSFSDELLQ